MEYECWAYKDGKPWKMVYVTASNKSEAESLAWEKFRDIGISVNQIERINCK